MLSPFAHRVFRSPSTQWPWATARCLKFQSHHQRSEVQSPHQADARFSRLSEFCRGFLLIFAFCGSPFSFDLETAFDLSLSIFRPIALMFPGRQIVEKQYHSAES